MGARGRGLAVVFAFAMVSVGVIVMPERSWAMTSHTWTTDTDWNSGTMHNLVVKDVGVPSYMELWQTATPTWIRMNPSTVPPGRDGYCLAYASGVGAFIMFGGRGPGGPLNDTWEYVFHQDTWTQRSPASSPPPLRNPGCAYDPVNAVVVLFGGLDGTGTWRNETWRYDVALGEWTRAFPSRSPGNIQETSLVFDRRAGRVLAEFQNAATWEMETWAYDAASNAWTDLHPAFLPRARNRMSLAYDEGANKTLLFAGAVNDTILCDTWVFDSLLNGWQLVRDCIPNVDPVERVGHGMAYRDAWYGDVLFGGVDDAGAYPEETWIFLEDSSMWLLPPIGAGPGGRTNVSLAHSPTDNATVLFGGFDGTWRNDTWALATGFTSGEWTSPVLDTSMAATDFSNLWWNQTNPVGGGLRFQVATSDSPVGPWTFRGPDGLPGSHYSVPGAEIWPGHDAHRYVRVLAKAQGALSSTLKIEDITITWMSGDPAWIVATSPPHGAIQVPVDAPIWVNFSEPMDTATVNWTIAPFTTSNATWSNSNTTLRLAHGPFEYMAVYTVSVTGKDAMDGLDLVPGPVPNPWMFMTCCAPMPYVVSTDPLPGGTPTDPYEPIVVTFSTPMDTATVAWSIAPVLPLQPFWSANDTVLTLYHNATPFRSCAMYAFTVSGSSVEGYPLVPGPWPNPWSWITPCPPAPGGLSVACLPSGDVRLDWADAPNATAYGVYEAQDRFAPFPSGWTVATSTISEYAAAGHCDDQLTHFYVVRTREGGWEGANSTMGVKRTFSFVPNPSDTNVIWFSLPYVSAYAKASDLANELGPAKVDVVGKWIAAEQRSVVFYYARGKWRGTNFPIQPGDGLYFGVRQGFDWPVVGTDADVIWTFRQNPPPTGNVNWIGLPYTGTYATASDLSEELTSSNISEVGLWDAAMQSVVRWYWDGSAWTGTDFAIAPGSGVSLVVVADFAWTPKLLTPYVP